VSQQPLNSKEGAPKPRTLPRTVRREMSALDEGDGHLWAVSYADLLMVLLAFFVIFFSFETEDSRDRGLRSIALGLQGIGLGEMVHPETVRSPAAIQGLRDALAKSADPMPMNVEIRGENLYLLLSDNIFAFGDYQLNAQIQNQLDQVSKALEPHREKIDVVVMGHSDSVQFAARRNEFLGDNFDLSALRALRGLQYLLNKGFSHEHISAQGAADGVRSSRTLSLRITWKGETL